MWGLLRWRELSDGLEMSISECVNVLISHAWLTFRINKGLDSSTSLTVLAWILCQDLLLHTGKGKILVLFRRELWVGSSTGLKYLWKAKKGDFDAHCESGSLQPTLALVLRPCSQRLMFNTSHCCEVWTCWTYQTWSTNRSTKHTWFVVFTVYLLLLTFWTVSRPVQECEGRERHFLITVSHFCYY